MALTFRQVRDLNAARSAIWHVGDIDNNWSGADWSNAMQGEAGGAGNVVKKLRRIDRGVPGVDDPPKEVLIQNLADEIADTYLYFDLLASHYNIDIQDAVVAKFNRVSRKNNFHQLFRDIYGREADLPGALPV